MFPLTLEADRALAIYFDRLIITRSDYEPTSKVPRRDRYPNFKYLGWHPWAKMNRRMRENGAMGAIENQAQDALAQEAVGELKNKLPKGKSGYVDVMMEEYDGPPEMSNEGPNKNQVPRLDNPQGPSQLYEDRGIVWHPQRNFGPKVHDSLCSCCWTRL
jgi:hypothetical protein